MYGNQFHFELTQLTSKNKSKIIIPQLNRYSGFIFIIAFLSFIALTSTNTFAGSKTGQLKGGNGNATGRPN